MPALHVSAITYPVPPGSWCHLSPLPYTFSSPPQHRAARTECPHQAPTHCLPHTAVPTLLQHPRGVPEGGEPPGVAVPPPHIHPCGAPPVWSPRPPFRARRPAPGAHCLPRSRSSSSASPSGSPPSLMAPPPLRRVTAAACMAAAWGRRGRGRNANTCWFFKSFFRMESNKVFNKFSEPHVKAGTAQWGAGHKRVPTPCCSYLSNCSWCCVQFASA